MKDVYMLLILVKCLLLVNENPAFGDEGSLMVIKTNEAENDGDINVEDEIEEDDVEVFTPTTEWKKVKKGQGIPRGLHVRMNLQTRETEAKLMENDGADIKTDVPAPKLTSGQIKEALKNFKGDDVKNPEAIHKAEHTFKTIDKIKKDFADLKINFKTDFEIMRGLMDILTSENVNNELRVAVYKDLEYYVHQYDNAQDFVKIGGFQIVVPSLNSTDDDVKEAAAFLLGSSMQSNPKVQIAGLESGLLQYVIRMLVFESSPVVRSRAMYALSCLVRHFPLAQQMFMEHGGLMALAKLFKPKVHDTNAMKLQVKSITLLNDLVEEQHLTAKHLEDNNTGQQEKMRQYSVFQLEKALVEQGWCDLVPKLLNAPDPDIHEKVIHAMLSLAGGCKREFQKHIILLRQLQEEYRQLAGQPDLSQASSDDWYFDELQHLIMKLIKSVGTSKDEL